MPTKKQKQINLLPKGNFEETTLGRIIKWALTTFRIMVILTEIVVMGAFLSRFWLDARNSDLNEQITIKKAQILAYSPVEDAFRLAQKRVDIAKSLYTNKVTGSTILTEVTKALPTDVYLSNISNSKNSVQIKAVSFSERSIAQLISNLEFLDVFSEITLSQISSVVDNESATSFTITAKIKEGV